MKDRDLFALAVMHASISHDDRINDITRFGQRCYEIADAMIEARGEQDDTPPLAVCSACSRPGCKGDCIANIHTSRSEGLHHWAWDSDTRTWHCEKCGRKVENVTEYDGSACPK